MMRRSFWCWSSVTMKRWVHLMGNFMEHFLKNLLLLVWTSVVQLFDFQKNNRQFQFCKIFRIKEPPVLVFWEKQTKIKESLVMGISETSKKEWIHGYHKRIVKESMVRKGEFLLTNCLQYGSLLRIGYEKAHNNNNVGKLITAKIEQSQCFLKVFFTSKLDG